ncbi:MAG: cytochrome c biogenesis protein ResB [Acidobacteriia bacterium]|nr:cytochrome c biogenesis protein ResB [Terriglobia bacterium]
MSSIKLGIYLLIILVVVSFIGTVVPQRPNTSPENLQIMFAPQNLMLLDKMGILDVFHSWWFKVLLTLLGLNIVFASIDRLGRAWKFVRHPVKILSEVVIRAQWQNAEFQLALSLDEAEELVRTQLKKSLGKAESSSKDGARVLFAQKHVYSRLAAYVIHLSLLIIFAGGLIGLEFGYRGQIRLEEGDATSHITLFDTQHSVVEAANEPRQLDRAMPFEIRLDRAEVQFNNPQEASLLRRSDIQSPGVVKNWFCTVSILESSNNRGSHVIAVNQPLSYRGFRFFQTGFDYGNGFKEMKLRVGGPAGSNDGETIYTVHMGDTFEIKEAQTTATVIRAGIMAEEDLPFVLLRLSKPGDSSTTEVPVLDANATRQFAAAGGTGPAPGRLPRGAQIVLADAVPRFASTFQVSRDPGVTTVWAGCVLLMLGLMMAFYFSHQRVWAMLIPKDEGTRLVIGGDASKNRSAFAKTFSELTQAIAQSAPREPSESSTEDTP